MKLLLKIVAFFNAQTVKNQSWLHSYMSDILVFFQHFVRYSLKVASALLFSLPCLKNILLNRSIRIGQLFHVSPCYLFTLFLSAHTLFDIRHIIIKHSRDSKSYFAHFFTLLHTIFLCSLYFPLHFLLKLLEAKHFFYVVGTKYCIIWYELSCYGVPFVSNVRTMYIATRRYPLLIFHIVIITCAVAAEILAKSGFLKKEGNSYKIACVWPTWSYDCGWPLYPKRI